MGRMSSDDGICTSCGEHTSVEDSCCGAGVMCDGSIIYPSEEEEEEEIDPCSRCNGTGIGQYGDPMTSRCTSCGGTGEKKKADEGYTIDDKRAEKAQEYADELRSAQREYNKLKMR